MGSADAEKIMLVFASKTKSGTGGSNNKVAKKSREKRQAKSIDVDAVLEAVESNSPLSDDTQDEKDKRAQGIVIDGRTYTCATCKSGHRVGMCKHARERPMTATHPPGRPPAGAPKKVICDCPKQCNCKKKDCKCARKCSCTQLMYMLVYVPEPGEEESANEEKGIWRLGQQVTTDLKGNILTPEQIRERQERKEAQKTLTPEKRTASTPTTTTSIPRLSTSPKSEAKPKELGGCCKHKENVATRNVAGEGSSKSSATSKSAADGCNCGSTCACAFCPQHPNNLTSMNMARQQATHFANQPYNQDFQSIVPFMPTMPQDISCMGGFPQFAISQGANPPSSNDLQKAFPYPGYLMAYPVYRTDHAYPIPAFPEQPHLGSEINLMSPFQTDDLPQQLVPTHPMESTQPSILPHVYSQEEFGIGNAFVTSAGPGGWNETFMPQHMWPIESPGGTPVVNDYAEHSEYPSRSISYPESITTPLQDNAGFEFAQPWDLADNSNYFDMSGTIQPAPGSSSAQPRTPGKSGSSDHVNTAQPPDPRLYANAYLSPTHPNTSPASMQP